MPNLRKAGKIEVVGANERKGVREKEGKTRKKTKTSQLKTERRRNTETQTIVIGVHYERCVHVCVRKRES